MKPLAAPSDIRSRLRRDAEAAFHEAVAEADPERATVAALDAYRGLLARSSRVLVVATGKAAAAMVRACGPAARGFALVPERASPRAVPSNVRLLEGGHPVPTATGIAASCEILRSIEAMGADDLLLYLVSGGSSSLFEVPSSGLAVDDVIATYRALLACGAPIADINAVRSVLSVVKAGGLSRAAYPARVLTLAVSDVVGNEPAVIGSGPTVCDPAPSPARAKEVVEERGLAPMLPAAVNDHLDHLIPATLPSGPAEIVDYRIVASNRTARAAAERALLGRGYDRVPAPLDPLIGDVDAAANIVATAVAARVADDTRWAFVAGGETTVRLPAVAGNGGRSRHFACRLADALEGVDGFALLSAGTDGIDGAGPAAGAIVDGGSAVRMRRAGHDPANALARFDTGAALAAGGDALQTGPTGTNVGDLVIAVGAPAARAAT